MIFIAVELSSWQLWPLLPFLPAIGIAIVLPSSLKKQGAALFSKRIALGMRRKSLTSSAPCNLLLD